MRRPLAEMLGLGRGSVAAVIGCGGKTALIARLCAEMPDDFRVFVGTTTKIYPPPYAKTLLTTAAAAGAHVPHAGVQCAGIPDPLTGKLGALPEELLEQLAARYDCMLLEADGSRGLPMKGWRPDEPVIPPHATHTLGVLPISALGLPATEEHVLRMPEFLQLTGLSHGETVTEGALSRMVRGMFAQSRGRASLLVNQVERDGDIRRAQRLLFAIRRDHPQMFDGLFYGSAHRGDWHAFEGEDR